MDAPQAYNSLGYVCMLTGRRGEAENFFAKAIELSPSYYAAAHDNLQRLRARSRTSGAGVP
jgi:hypothetical protein